MDELHLEFERDLAKAVTGENTGRPNEQAAPVDESPEPDLEEKKGQEEKIPEIIDSVNHELETLRIMERNWIRVGNTVLPGEFGMRKFITLQNTGQLVPVKTVRKYIKRGSHHLDTSTYTLIKNP